MKMIVGFIDDDLNLTDQRKLDAERPGNLKVIVDWFLGYAPFSQVELYSKPAPLIKNLENNDFDFDLIFIDRELSAGVDGIDLGKKIAAFQPNAALVVLSRHSVFSEARRAMQNNFIDFISKNDYISATDMVSAKERFYTELAAIQELPAFLAKQKAKKVRKERDAAFDAVNDILSTDVITKKDLLHKLEQINPPDSRYKVLFEVIIDLINELLPSAWKLGTNFNSQKIAGAVSTIVNDVLVDKLLVSKKIKNNNPNSKGKRLQEYWEYIASEDTLDTIKEKWSIEIAETKEEFKKSLEDNDMNDFRLLNKDAVANYESSLKKYYESLKSSQNSILNSHYKKGNQEIVNEILKSKKYKNFEKIMPQDKKTR